MTAIQELVVTRQLGALAKNTQTGYSTGIRSFVSFCISGRNQGFLTMMLPAKDEALAAWVVFMVEKRQVKPSTAKQYTSGGAPPADVAAQLAALTEALAQQQRQHAETMAAMQAQLAAQEARANAAATKAAADAAQLLANRQAANAFQTELSLLAASPMVTEAWSLQELDVLTEVLVFHGARLKIDSKCKTLDEWETSFLKLALQARSPAAGSTLLEFHAWFRLRAVQFGFKILQEFYCQLIKQVAAGTASMEQGQWNLLWSEFQLVKFREGIDLFVPSSVRAEGQPLAKKPKPAVPSAPKTPPAAKKKIQACFGGSEFSLSEKLSVTGDLKEEVEGADGAQGDCLLQGPGAFEGAGVPVAAALQGFLTMMLPAKDEALAAWVVFMVEKRQVKPSTAKQYTSGSGFFDSGAR
ncbi:hypothetical protein CYMTET_39397 [Cymbomonas tetramitiformis]|uniref:Uncharacterized protein n=1 Tax=Cymbomonas tetramitiformis TaxID=36881 RepID=A0AAE0F4A3_9CHLO|nr:hypothetical protein CYMTET_39397 [Cymbomonas tetramitiformis]